MTSRRPMTRSFSGNGRASSFNEEDNGSANGRPESRNTYLSNVRPENRSTLCTVMAQLTEDIQPSFDTTLKSKAVSENCNVKFTCVVSGYPAPELKWYKDDMEMDRYCGLPKYEIRRNGKTHTLQIYNCSLDDAAIYQVSACNSKGIVSCSGVLEVGTMNEYQIHQRFFAKLKQKAEKKKKEAEEQMKKKDEGKEQGARAKVSPERPPRKRPISQTAPAVKEPEAVEQPVAETNGMPPEVAEAAPATSMDDGVGKETPPSEETLVQKKMKATNGVDAEANKADNCYDGGISLAQFLAQTLQSQAAEEKQNPSQAEKPPEMDSAVDKEDAPERTLRTDEQEDIREETDGYQEKEDDRPSRTTELPKHHGKARKDHDHHHIQASLSSMLHSVKDFFFGKGKKDSHHLIDSTECYQQPSPPQTPPSYRLHAEQIGDPQNPDDSVPMVIDEACYPTGDVAREQHDDEPQDRHLHLDSPEAHKSPHEDLRDPTGQNDKDVPVATTEVSVGAEINAPGEDMALSGPQVSTETDESVSGSTQIPPVKPDSALPANKIDNHIVTDVLKSKPGREGKTDSFTTVEDLLKTRSSERLCFKPPIMPSLSPSSLRKFKPTSESENEAGTVPVITVDDRPGDKAEDDLSGGSTPTSSLSCESSPRLKRRDSLSLIRSATPEELASGARRKIFIPKTKDEGDGIADVKRESPYMSPSQARRAALLQAPMGQKTPPMERRSPLMSRRKATLDVPKVVEEPVKTPPEEKPAEKKLDPLKAPQVIRKIRGEPFPDASGHLKLWCQFFNVLSDATIKWYRDEEEILEVNRSGGDESQVALAVVLASSKDCGVYGCTISNEYGTDTTDFLLSEDILAEILLRDDLEVGEEIEMTPLLFAKGLANSGSWGEKYFGRIMTETANVGEGWCHKASKVRVIYGLNPIFESGSHCIMKVQNPIAYGTKQESNLVERNLEITKQECKTQNMIREYCKIFAAEARVQENFGCGLEVVPQYLMYRPANSVPYATVEEELSGVFFKYCMTDAKGRLILRSVSEMEQKCCTFQHWIYEWTHGNLLVTRLEGVGTKLTNVRVVTKNKGYQSLTERGSPEVFEQFLAQHQCNYYCGLLSLRPLKSMDSLQQPAKMKGSRSPLLNRKVGSGSPGLQRKGQSPQMSRKTNLSPRVSRKVQETEDNKSDVSLRPVGDGSEPR
ncbi:alpha-protein kinase 3 [Neosynchiropus ocellatus]